MQTSHPAAGAAGLQEQLLRACRDGALDAQLILVRNRREANTGKDFVLLGRERLDAIVEARVENRGEQRSIHATRRPSPLVALPLPGHGDAARGVRHGAQQLAELVGWLHRRAAVNARVKVGPEILQNAMSLRPPSHPARPGPALARAMHCGTRTTPPPDMQPCLLGSLNGDVDLDQAPHAVRQTGLLLADPVADCRKKKGCAVREKRVEPSEEEEKAVSSEPMHSSRPAPK